MNGSMDLPMSGERNWRGLASWLLGGVLLAIVAFFGVRAILANAHGPVRLVIYAFSTQEEVLTQGIFPAFEQAWETETGRELTIEGVFGPSATLAGQINLGAPADVTLFSNAQHVTWLQVGHRVRSKTEPAVVGYTPMVIVVRPGMAGVADLADLAQPGLRLLHADPRSSGAGEWAVLAEYGSALMQSGDPAAAEAVLKATWQNVQLLGASARSTLTLFELGAGDALVTYEQDARLAAERGVPLEIIIPSRTIIAQPVAVIVDDNVSLSERPAAEAFIDFLLSNAGQQIFGRYHLRPATLEADEFPPLSQTFTVEELGGWSQAHNRLVEELWQQEIEPRLDLDPGAVLLNTGEQ